MSCCERSPVRLAKSPTTYVAVDGTIDGVYLNATRWSVTLGLHCTGVGVEGDDLLVVGSSLAASSTCVAMRVNTKTNTVSQLALPLTTKSLHGRVGSNGTALVLTATDTVLLLDSSLAVQSVLLAPNVGDLALGIPNTDLIVYSRQTDGVLLGIHALGSEPSPIVLSATPMHLLGVGVSSVLATDGKGLFELKAVGASIRLVRLDDLPLNMFPQSAFQLDGRWWLACSIDMPTETWIIDSRGEHAYVARHGTHQMTPRVASEQEAVLPTNPNQVERR